MDHKIADNIENNKDSQMGQFISIKEITLWLKYT